MYWQGLEVWLADPADMLVLQLSQARQWGSDQGHLKPADYFDAQVLLERYALPDDLLIERARELGGAATWRAFQRVCWPPAGRLEPDAGCVQAEFQRAVREDGGPTLRRSIWQRRLQALPHRLPYMLRTAPDVAAAWNAVRWGGDPRRSLERWLAAAPPPKGLGRAEMSEILQSIHWWNRLLYPRQIRRGVCVPRAYASFRALRRYGYAATLYSGVRREGATCSVTPG